ncbi:nucleoside diphosphate kinase regulator [Sandaracinobacteroides sp. A072]|uniref:nucleoside diphosphate kinase regulator n=1 Tax=Sandaracinobacteroides sp. A072 TaxID=3461146 RepID=UPI00404153DD
MTTNRRRAARPALILSESEADSLAGLATDAEDRVPEVAELLLGEIERARIVKDGSVPPGTVRMGSEVVFEDEGSGRTRTVTLVWPAEADIAAGRISVLTPVGAGLIGLSQGQVIDWPDRDGRKRSLKIVSVTRPA